MSVGVDPFAPVTAVISGKMNASQARDEQKRQHRYNKELMGLSYMFGQAEQQNAAYNTKLGYQKAGMSPALAAAGQFAPASGPSALASTPAPSRYPKMDSPASMSDLLQLKFLEAQIENINANTEGTEIKNEQEKNANEVSQLLADTYFTKLAGVARFPEEKAQYEKLASIAKNKGAFGLMSEYLDTLDKKELYDYHYWEYALKRDVAWYQKNSQDGKIMVDIASMPTKQKEQLEEMSKWYVAQVEQLKAQKNLTDEERNLKLEQTKLTQEQIQNLKAATENLKNTNIIKMMEKGEYMKALGATILLLFGQVSVSKHF